MEKKNVIFFGASNLGIKAYFAFKDKFNIIYFCDNDKNKWGATILDVPIISPKDLRNIEYPQIIISSTYFKEILVQLAYILMDKKMKDINVVKYNKNIEEDYNTLSDFSIEKSNFSEINSILNELILNIEKSYVLGINITDVQRKYLIYNLCEYFNITEEEVKTLKITNYDFIKLVDDMNDFKLFEILYNLGNIAVTIQLIERELYLLTTILIDKKDLLINSVKKMFNSSNLSFVEKVHFYSMLSAINSKPYIFEDIKV